MTDNELRIQIERAIEAVYIVQNNLYLEHLEDEYTIHHALGLLRRERIDLLNMPNLVEHTEEKNGFLKIQQLLFYNDLIEVLNNPDSIYNYAYWRPTYYG
jgi:hypothetical protein